MYESRYHGLFNYTIGTLLHIPQWTRPNLNFALSRLACFTRAPNKLAFIALEHLMRYLYFHLHETILYPKKKARRHQNIQ